MTIADDLELRLLLLRDEVRSRISRIRGRGRGNRTYLLPHGVESRRAEGIALAAIVKNEAHYLAEWIEFHLLLGVRHVFLYDNGSTDNSPEVLAPYIRDQLVTIIPWVNFSGSLNPQALAYNHALTNFGPDFAWMAFIDVDEFLYPTKADPGRGDAGAFASARRELALDLFWPLGARDETPGVSNQEFRRTCRLSTPIRPVRSDQIQGHRQSA